MQLIRVIVNLYLQLASALVVEVSTVEDFLLGDDRVCIPKIVAEKMSIHSSLFLGEQNLHAFFVPFSLMR